MVHRVPQIAAFVAAVLLLFTTSLAQKQAATRTPAVPEMHVDINHASMDELLKVPGMTRTWAERIVRFRPYRAKNDLLDRGVVSSEVYDRIKDYVVAHRDKP